MAPEKGTGRHRHEADSHIVLMLKGWGRFIYDGKETLVAAGDCVTSGPQSCISCSTTRPTWNPEVVGPAEFTTIESPAAAEVPDPAPWPAEAKAA